jgi:uncharacterized protein (TIGR02147 family)
VDRLILAGLIEQRPGGALFKRHAKLTTEEDKLSSALQKSHQDSLRIAAHKLETIDVHLRDFSTISFPTSPEKIAVAKELLREFRQQVSELMEKGSKTEVYELAIQLYPLTR